MPKGPVKKSAKKMTPMMQQYMEVRKSLPPNSLLLFRLGDFYEMFDEDAAEGARILGITLTRRNGQPMAGIPFHAADNYVQKLLAAGKKVAICDQVETPKPGKIVKRELTRILTPGTAMEDHQISAQTNNYLLAVCFEKKQLAAAWLDLTTGEFCVAAEEQPTDLLPVFNSLDAAEVLVPETAWQEWSKTDSEQIAAFVEAFAPFAESRSLSELPDYQFDCHDGFRAVTEALGVLSLEGFGLSQDHPAIGAAAAIIGYATDSLCGKPENLRSLREYRSSQSLLLDPATLRNLEIFRSARNTRAGTLLEAMDCTVTAPGCRLLEQYLATPSLELEELRRRQDCVEAFLESPGIAAELQEYLGCVRDLPRILGRLENRIRNPREIGGIRDTLEQLPFVLQVLEQFDQDALTAYRQRVQDYPDLTTLLEAALNEELPSQLTEGGYIRDGYDTELDRLRSLGRDSKRWIADLEREEQDRTGIRNLRIKFNNAFGYFIEVTKSNLHRVPEEYVRKQTMTNAERYTTPELKEKEKEILSADERAVAREEELFREVVAAILEQTDELLQTAQALAELDVYAGWAKLAREWDYCRPELDDSLTLEIEAGRHPVVEQMMRKDGGAHHSSANGFVPNDAVLGAEDEQIAIITGPNMAGKSTYIRQVALIVLMAQVGCWVPAKRCRLGLVDRIFSRVGASDELARGNSTFMVEMNETANILNNATERSLIILDEIGRGTSTYDGLSIAWAVVEYLHGAVSAEGNGAHGGLLADGPPAFANCGPRTLFATHYHELTQVERQLNRVRNYSVAVKEWNDEIIFVRQVNRGAADRSYGIQVARLAGLPGNVIDRAKTILEKLEADDSSHNLLRKRMRKIKKAQAEGEEPQLELF